MGLTPVQKDMLIDLLLHGDDKAENVGNRTNHHRNTVSSHMGTLVEEGYLTGKGGGVYRLREPGRDAALGLIKSGYNPYVDGD
jgi:predicted transcriptional regulator